MAQTHKLDFFRGERFDLLARGINKNGQVVGVEIRRCDVVECEFTATAVRGQFQLCGMHAKKYDAEHGK